MEDLDKRIREAFEKHQAEGDIEDFASLYDFEAGYKAAQPRWIPEFLLEISKQMNEQENRLTSHPFWQVRCKRFLITEEGYNEHHWILCDDDGEFYRSDMDGFSPAEALMERYPEFCKTWAEANQEDFLEGFDPELDDLPDSVRKIHMQEVEEVVSTHLTQHDAEWFIKRKQHDYPPLYTYVESAYWSPQLRELQDWIISLQSSTRFTRSKPPEREE